MQRHSYILKIDKPCRQDWNSMTKSDIGKFCSSCSKTVVDFTDLTDSEVIQLVEQADGKLCGRLTNQQLNRSLMSGQHSSNFRIRKILAGLLLFGATENSLAIDKPILQTEIFSVTDSEGISPVHFEVEADILADSSKYLVQGKILDKHSSEPLAFATVLIKDTKVGVSADMDGNFKFIIPDSLIAEKITLVVFSIGYERSEVTIDNKDFPIAKDILILSTDQVLYGDICVIKEKKWWQFWK